jgi:hypothetical protein
MGSFPLWFSCGLTIVLRPPFVAGHQVCAQPALRRDPPRLSNIAEKKGKGEKGGGRKAGEIRRGEEERRNKKRRRRKGRRNEKRGRGIEKERKGGGGKRKLRGKKKRKRNGKEKEEKTRSGVGWKSKQKAKAEAKRRDQMLYGRFRPPPGPHPLQPGRTPPLNLRGDLSRGVLSVLIGVF